MDCYRCDQASVAPQRAGQFSFLDIESVNNARAREEDKWFEGSLVA
jgi:hypothetical protein